DDLERGVAMHHRARLAEAIGAGVGPDAHPGAAVAAGAPLHLKRLDARDLHRALPVSECRSFTALGTDSIAPCRPIPLAGLPERQVDPVAAGERIRPLGQQ